MSAREYNIDAVDLIIGGRRIQEFMDGTAINVEFEDDETVAVNGTHGSVAFSKKNRNTAAMTISLMQTAPINSYLMDLASARATVAVYLRDSLGDTIVSSTQAKVKKLPDLEFADEAGAREWELVLVLPNDAVQIGGNVLS